jgi:hypothetical protein
MKLLEWLGVKFFGPAPFDLELLNMVTKVCCRSAGDTSGSASQHTDLQFLCPTVCMYGGSSSTVPQAGRYLATVPQGGGGGGRFPFRRGYGTLPHRVWSGQILTDRKGQFRFSGEHPSPPVCASNLSPSDQGLVVGSTARRVLVDVMLFSGKNIVHHCCLFPSNHCPLPFNCCRLPSRAHTYF